MNTRGSIVDAVYYNNLKALKSVTHSGDEQTGEKSGLDEVIWVNFANMAKLRDEDKQVKLVIFVVCAYTGGSLSDAKNVSLHVLEEKKDNEVGRYAIQARGAAEVVAVMERADGGSWSAELLNVPAEGGRHFIDILEPTLGNIIRSRIPGAPARQKVAFAMEKGGVVDFPETATLGQVYAGLGWDVSATASEEIDLDVSAVCFSKDGRELGAVFFGNTEDFGLVHSGDNLDGAGEGDDEVISADLENIPPNVDQIFFVVNVYTNGVTFGQVSNAYCRIFDCDGVEMARYLLREGQGERGLIISRLFRVPGNRWGFQALGQFCRGKTWKDAIPDVTALVRRPATDFQFGGSSTMSFADSTGVASWTMPAASAPPTGSHAGAGWAGEPGRPSVTAVPPQQGGQKKDCTVM